MAAPDYQVFIVDHEGVPQAGSGDDGEVLDARVVRLSWELNGVGAAVISLPTTNPDAALLTKGTEIQIWRAGQIIWWGVVIRPEGQVNESTWQCRELLWYFGRRHMGRADRTNLLTNGDFEAGEDDWDFENGVTHSIDTGTFLEGSQSLKLEGATANHTGYAIQSWTHPAGGYPTGDYVTASVWVYIPSADYDGGAVSDFGLLVRHRNSSGTIIDSQGGPGSDRAATIDDDTIKDQWIQLETGVGNVKEGDQVDVLLFPPHGVAYFDLATLTYMESLSFGYPAPGVDVTDIIGGIVGYAQDPTAGKSDLTIGFAGDDSGTTRQVAYQFAEHRNILDAILEFVREGICDISIEITATTRTFTVWPKSADSRTPKFGKGVAYSTALEWDVNLADFTYASDLEQGASDVVLLGPGDGPDRPEGGASDPAFVGGKFTAEIIEQAPDNVTIGQLDARAAERLAVAARPDILEVTTLPGAGIIGSLKEGDTVQIQIQHGWVDIDDTYRVARIDADLNLDKATITVNPIP